MLKRLMIPAAILVVLSAISLPTETAANYLEVMLDKYETPGGDPLYGIELYAQKTGAATCTLETPTGTYSGLVGGGEFLPEEGFFADHADMDFAGLTAAISTSWTITWDGGPGQTVATLSFGTVQESEFLPVPTLTSPVNGVPLDPNPPTVEWNYGATPPCDAQLDAVEVALSEQLGTTIYSGELPCSATSWTPSSPLPEGTWTVEILNTISDYRLVPEGITIVEGEWVIENEDWVALRSLDTSQNEVVSTESGRWGAIKALFRR